MNDGKLSGAVALVIRHGKVAYLKFVGYRDIESRSPITDDVIFRIASQSKALVSLGAMILQEEGKLLISEPVGKHIQQFDSTTVAVPIEGGGFTVVPAKRKIAIRDLLTHTAGIGYGSGPAADKWTEAGIQGWYFADRDEPNAAEWYETIRREANGLIAGLPELPMSGHPATREGLLGCGEVKAGIAFVKTIANFLTFVSVRILGMVALIIHHQLGDRC